MKRSTSTLCLIALLLALATAPALDARARDDGHEAGAAFAAALLAGLAVSGVAPAPVYTHPHDRFVTVDRYGRRIYRDASGRHYTVEGSRRVVLGRRTARAGSGWWSHHTERQVWQDCHRHGPRVACSHYVVNRFGERVYLD